jgi:hypothetical protein
LAGSVRDSETGAPLAGVGVDIGSGPTVFTDRAGHYAFASGCDRGGTCANDTYFDGHAIGYESRYGDGDARLQRSITITAGDAVAGALFPDESSIDPTENNCSRPCKLVRVPITSNGVFDARLVDPAAELGLKILWYGAGPA